MNEPGEIGGRDGDPIAMFLKFILQLDTKYPTARFRNIYLNKEGTRIIMCTRSGGDNRICTHSDYFQTIDDEDILATRESYECGCEGCQITFKIPDHPNYLGDEDDEDDKTYADVFYSVPKEFEEHCRLLASGMKLKKVLAICSGSEIKLEKKDTPKDTAVETLRFTSDTEWHKFLEYDLGWSFNGYKRYGISSKDLPPRVSFKLGASYAKNHEIINITYEILLREPGGPVELYEMDRLPQGCGRIGPCGPPILETPIETYPNLRACFREICEDPPGPGDLDESLMTKLSGSGLRQYVYWGVRRRVEVVKVVLREYFPEVLVGMVVDFLTPKNKKSTLQEIKIDHKVEEDKLLIKSSLWGEVIVMIEVISN